MSKRVAKCGLLIALAMVFSYVEVLIPFNFGIPGIKLGLANLIVVVGFYSMKTTDVIAVSLVRIFLSGLLFGNLMSILYSLSGGILSIIVMLLLKRLHRFSIVDAVEQVQEQAVDNVEQEQNHAEQHPEIWDDPQQ